MSSKFDALICDGAVRSGKTLCMSISFVVWAMQKFDRQAFAICGKTVTSCQRNVITALLPVLEQGAGMTCNYVRSKNYIEIKQGKRSNIFYVFGGRDESSASLIQGVTLAGLLLDEVALMPRSFVEQALARCSVENSKFWFNCNPESPNHWFYTEWIVPAKKRWLNEKRAIYLHFLMEDNPSLSDKIKQRYENLYSGVFYQRYIQGEWVVAEGAIYKIFSENKQKYYTNAPDYDFIQVGIDFGGNGSAHTFCASGLKHDYSKLTALMTERHEAAGLSPDDLYNLLAKFIIRVQTEYGKVMLMHADSAEQTLINGIKARFDIPVRNSIKNCIIDRIRATTSLMSEGKFFITSDCESLEKAFETAVYDNKQLDDIRLDNGTSDIDTLDAFEYSWERYIKQLAMMR